MKEVLARLMAVVMTLGLITGAAGCEKRSCGDILNEIQEVGLSNPQKSASLAKEAFSAGCHPGLP